MANTTKAEKWAEIHERAITRFNRCYSSQKEVRDQCMQDRRFVYVPGSMWEGQWGDQYQDRPRFEVNKCHHSVQKIIGEYKNNRITVKFRPASKGSKKTAETLDGLYRADEQYSNANEAYDNAFDEAVSGGFGAWRYVAKYEDDEDEESEKQRICIEPIFDADQSVFFDIDAKRQDKKDANYCFVIASFERETYIEEYGEISSFDKSDHFTLFDWFSPDVVYVAEYFEIEKVSKTVLVYLLSETGEEEKVDDDDEERIAELETMGFILARKKKITNKVVHKYILDGARILEDCGRIAGKNIPIVPVYGKRAFVSNVERIQGHVRLTTDVMRVYNMLISLLGEIAIASPIERPIFTDSQIRGKEAYWAQDNIKRFPYQLVNDVLDPATGQQIPMGPLAYTKPPTIPQAIIGLMELCNMDMKELLGSQENGEKMIANVSARAVELVQNQLAMQTFIYTDSMAKSMRRGGEIWKDMAIELNDSDEDEYTIIKEDGEVGTVKLYQPTMKDGVAKRENDLEDGKYEVVADVGPSYLTRRDNTVRALTGVLQYFQNPQEQSVIAATIVENLDGDGIDGLQKWARTTLLNAGAAIPTDEETQEMQAAAQNKQPDPNAMYLMAEAGKSQALAVKAEADTMKALAESEQTQAETAKILTETDSAKLDNILRIMEQLQQASASQMAPPQAEQPAPQQEGMPL